MPPTEPEEANRLVFGTATGGLGAALTATAASMCCLGPAVVSLLGVSGAVAAAGIAPYRPYLLAVSLGMLAWGFWLAYRPVTSEGASCSRRAGRWVRTVLWAASGLTLVAILLPFIVQ